MSAEKITITRKDTKYTIAVNRNHTLILGSGAAGLNAAVQLHAHGCTDLCIVTEGLDMGTSINTGSDKQTYYKLGMYGEQDDSPVALAHSFFNGGGMHGDIALVEAGLSARAFFNLVDLGVEFPRDCYGQFVGYKTDHDPRRRATSFGPYTSREMCRVLIREVKRRGIEIHEGRVAVSLLTLGEGKNKKVAGAVVINSEGGSTADSFELYLADNLVFATGGPGGLYTTSVYPMVHTGGIGLALMAGAQARNLPESQYGLASTSFRWNVSGTYMQVVPRFISTAADGRSDEKEFLLPFFSTAGEMNSMIFLKGYQWPFDPRKCIGGSSIIDILVYIETVIKGRRVFLDYRRNGEGFDFSTLSDEARTYLQNSDALRDTPIERLAKMNRPAIDLYRDHDIDITAEPLEIAVCAQHNNGGLAGTIWYESTTIGHLFPIGEVNGSHGVYRPGGSALNSGQVAGYRVAEYIAHAYAGRSLDYTAALETGKQSIGELLEWIEKNGDSQLTWREAREQFQSRMSRAGAHIRSPQLLTEAVAEARKQHAELCVKGTECGDLPDTIESLRNLQLCFAHIAYLDAVLYAVNSGVGSRGSSLVIDKNGTPVHPGLGDDWRFHKNNPQFEDKVLETMINKKGECEHQWVERRPIPKADAWFETAWEEYREGAIYKEQG